MTRILCCLIFVLPLTQAIYASEAKEPQAEDYTLSMAGALINDYCGRSWQEADYITIHACNYQLATRYNLATSTRHFDECTVVALGDIIKIADCMVERFSSWLAQPQEDENIAR